MSAVSETAKTTPRIIEREMPLAAISAQSGREKSIRHGHLSTLHIWWARRPLAACRAAIFAALVPEPEDPGEAKRMQAFIASLSDWDNSIDNPASTGGKPAHFYIRDAREMIRKAFPDRAPRVLDPFAGGGAIPLEALRLGCETHALDLNPVAHIIQLATLIYPQRYALRPGPYGDKPGATLMGDVRKWGNWVLEQARTEIGDLYPQDADGATVVAYLWARTVPCPNLGCRSAVPLIRQTWLARKAKKYVAYKIEADGPGSVVRFRVVTATKADGFDFDPSIGTSRGGTATCPCCGTPLSEEYIKSESVAGNLGALPVAAITSLLGEKGKRCRDITARDRETFEIAGRRLETSLSSFDPFKGDLYPIPDEKIAQRRITGGSCVVYGLDDFGKLFNGRQKFSLISFMRFIREAAVEIGNVTKDSEYTDAVVTYLAIALDRLADSSSGLVRWLATVQAHANTFGRQGLPMVWDYAEINPVGGGSGSWRSGIDWITEYIEHGARTAVQPADVIRGTATNLPYADGYFDAVITDPPYLDNISYATVSDFFYVWLKRTVGDIYPNVLGAPVTPKDQEIIRGGALRRTETWFEEELERAFSECSRVLKDKGICIVVYAHKAISAWESLIASLLRAGLTVDGSWPFSTERGARLVGLDRAALASSIFLVCRKRHTDAGVGYASDVRAAITANVRERLNVFWDAGLRGADFFISAIGPATAAFSRYTRVETLGGKEVTVSTLLQWVQEEVADYALGRVFTRGAATSGVEAGLGNDVDDATRFYVLWRWTYDGSSLGGVVDGAAATPIDVDGVEIEEDAQEGSASKPKVKKIPFGDAHLMAIALGADIQELRSRQGILEGSSDVRLLTAAERAERYPNLGERRAESRTPLIDILHRAELLWTHGNEQELSDYLDEVLPLDREPFRRVAQALVDLLPRGDVEKQRLEGLLAGKVADGSGGAGVQTPPATQAGFIEIGQQDVTRGTRGRK